MSSNSKSQIVKDFQEKSVLVSREFDAPLDLVWRAYTDSKILDQWWGPAPWRAETKTMDFRVGGFWHYCMVGPEGERHWGRMDYLDITPKQRYRLEDAFCDENAIPLPGMPVSKGETVFTPTASGTLVEFKMVYATEEDLKTIVEMGFEQGITACIEQLDALLKAGKI